MVGPIATDATAAGAPGRNACALTGVLLIEADVRQTWDMRAGLGRALEWSAVMIGLLWLFMNARRTLGSGA